MPSLWIVWIIFQEYGYASSTSGKAHESLLSSAPEMINLCRTMKSDRHGTSNRTILAKDNQLEAVQDILHPEPVPFTVYQPSPTIKHQHQLQYIDYKLHYGLRYNPRYDGSKANVQRHPSSKNTSSWNATKVSLPALGVSPIRERNKLIPPKQYETPAVPLLSVINIITFVNGPCVPRRNAPGNTSSVVSWMGICYHEKECSQLKGIPMDTCAGGFGVCCVFQYGCDSRSEQNVSYFLSPSFPSPAVEPLPCTFTLALHRSVRQVVLEFVFFELQPPQLGNCIEDQFVVSIQNDHRIYPVLCGVNSGQHMYLDIDRAYSHLVFLNAVFSSRQPRAFLVKITQLSTPRAPMNCLQFHDGLSGIVKSFNYDNYSTVVKHRKASYLNNLNYAICIKRHIMFCNVVFTNENALGKENIFQLVNIAEDGSSLVPPNQAGVEIFSCPDDYIAINYMRLCGERLNDGSVVADFTRNTPVSYTSAGPILIAVRSDESIVGRGFKLTYKQNVCIDKIV
ncbi:hypothetical protein ZHAS_00003944 [Anopheles sinensis]|uniref:CUB domain-containing protein n=1 Tax=Anopheles sinensis TaxID=74873 RepID=A0A084VFP0_ANOSI|nr:hypothetical protein ZHAS_00003944 [Anopheles sinensis]